MNKKRLLTFGAIITFSFFVGFFFGDRNGKSTMINPKYLESKSQSENSFDAGWLSAKEIIENSGSLITSGGEIHALHGVVTNVGKNGFSFVTDYVSRNPLANKVPKDRFVKITPDTIFYVRRMMSDDSFREAQLEYSRNLAVYRETVQKNGALNVSPPRPANRFEDVKGSFSSLKDDGEVLVQVNKQDIETLIEFTADVVYIIIQ